METVHPPIAPSATASWRERLAPLAARLDPSTAQVLDAATVVRLSDGAAAFGLASPCRAFLLVVEGAVRVELSTAEGRAVTLYRVGPGEACVLTVSCLLSGDRYPAYGVAEGDVVALAVSSEAFWTAMERSEGFRRLVFAGLGKRLAVLVHRIESVAYGDLDQRICAAVLDMSHSENEARVTHHTLAVEVGTAREVVSRHLKRLEVEGRVRLGRGRIELLDRPALERIAGRAR
ncbi:MAG: Crp/Fnr family transcriptional regulator [Chromatiales bacterium]|nr:Crp/Fnr family transcriptional regulator [Chromatiales bacterium]